MVIPGFPASGMMSMVSRLMPFPSARISRARRCTRWMRRKPSPKLASEQAKGIESIAADFGVGERYVKQRMKLAALAPVVKTAFRNGEIDTAAAEATFAAVPADRQMQVWKEANGQPQAAP